MKNYKEFTKEKGDSLYYKGSGQFVFIVPEIFFDRGYGIIDGEYVTLLGIINYAILDNPEDKINPSKIYPFKFPSLFVTKPNSIEKVKDVELFKNKPADDYRILRYNDNNEDQIVVSKHVVQDIENVEAFFAMFFTTGKIPKGLSYDKLHDYVLEAIELNGASYGVNASMIGMIVRELCKDPNNVHLLFAQSPEINKDMTNYQSISIKENAKLVSPFTGVSSENWDEAMIYAGVAEEKNIKDTPMERIMMD